MQLPNTSLLLDFQSSAHHSLVLDLYTVRGPEGGLLVGCEELHIEPS